MLESKAKSNGVYYTPPDLANFIASLAISNQDAKILDPAYGQCALLNAAKEQLIRLGSKTPNNQLFGFDIQPIDTIKNSHYCSLLDENNLVTRNFFEINKKFEDQAFDVIIMNPPFVRHHYIEKSQLEKIRSAVGFEIALPRTSDLWAYFIIHSLSYLKEHGRLTAILPWSFLQAKYSKIIRQKLLESFETLNVVIIGKRMFDEAQERVLVLHGENHGYPVKKINISYSLNIPSIEIKYDQITKEDWINNPVYRLGFINQILKQVTNKAQFNSLGEYSKIKIGTVTGANSFFIIDKSTSKNLDISKTCLKPIIKHASELKSLDIDNKSDVNNYLLTIDADIILTEPLRKYIEAGESKGMHQGYHTKNRDIWYLIEKPTPPDAFMPYMTKEIPFITLNKAEVLSTNSIHQLFFNNNVTRNTIEWIQFSMLSSISQLSIELYSKTYGGGVLKIEPSSAKKIFVYAGNGKELPISLRRKVNKLLANGNKKAAIEFVDQWFIDNLDISKKDIERIKEHYEFLSNVRLNKQREL